jgi:hypothetical protein
MDLGNAVRWCYVFFLLLRLFWIQAKVKALRTDEFKYLWLASHLHKLRHFLFAICSFRTLAPVNLGVERPLAEKTALLQKSLEDR